MVHAEQEFERPLLIFLTDKRTWDITGASQVAQLGDCSVLAVPELSSWSLRSSPGQMTGGHVDRRGPTRFRLQATVICRWKDEEGSQHEIDGLARDISSGGVYVVSSVPPPAGIQLGVEVLLPPLRPGLQQVQLQSDGEVVRVERSVPKGGFAVMCDFGMID
jgi:hypothetical protein